MKRVSTSALSIAILTLFVGFGLISCKDDDPPAKPKLSFADPAMNVNEGAGTIEVELILDKPHSADLRIEYTLGGTALDQDAVGTANADYRILGQHGVVRIEQGETSGFIEIEIIQDNNFEPDETIEISIFDINTDAVELTEDDKTIVTIKNDDAAIDVAFESQSMSVVESDRIIQVKLIATPAPTQDLTITYALSGSAVDSVSALSNEELDPDYAIIKGQGEIGKVVIKAGQTTGIINIRLYSDLLLEDTDPNTLPLDPESIVITATAPAGVTMTDNTMEISLKQENGLLIALFWPDPDDGQQADMDLILRVGESTSEWLGVLAGSAAGSFESPELIFIPNVVDFPAYGLSYTYYEGTLDPLNFEVFFIDIIDQAFEPAADVLSYAATYTAANINPWQNVSETLVVQTFEKTETGFSTPSAISVPAEGSRIRHRDNFTSTLNKATLRSHVEVSRLLQRYRGR
jgi:hypothetical protein